MKTLVNRIAEVSQPLGSAVGGGKTAIMIPALEPIANHFWEAATHHALSVGGFADMTGEGRRAVEGTARYHVNRECGASPR
jgi:hypothetical protein